MRSKISTKHKRGNGFYENKTTGVISEIVDAYKKRHISREDAYALISLALNNDINKSIASLVGSDEESKADAFSMLYVDHYRKYNR